MQKRITYQMMLKEARNKLGLTSYNAAKLLKISYQRYLLIESTQRPKEYEIKRLIDVLKLDKIIFNEALNYVKNKNKHIKNAIYEQKMRKIFALGDGYKKKKDIPRSKKSRVKYFGYLYAFADINDVKKSINKCPIKIGRAFNPIHRIITQIKTPYIFGIWESNDYIEDENKFVNLMKKKFEYKDMPGRETFLCNIILFKEFLLQNMWLRNVTNDMVKIVICDKSSMQPLEIGKPLKYSYF